MAKVETRELIEAVRRVAKEQPIFRSVTILYLNLAAAELERLAYPPKCARCGNIGHHVSDCDQ